MDPIHRKIELQSLDDLRYLIENVNQAANERIDSHFPGDGKTRTDVDAQAEAAKGSEVEGIIRAVRRLIALLSNPCRF